MKFLRMFLAALMSSSLVMTSTAFAVNVDLDFKEVVQDYNARIFTYSDYLTSMSKLDSRKADEVKKFVSDSAVNASMLKFPRISYEGSTIFFRYEGEKVTFKFQSATEVEVSYKGKKDHFSTKRPIAETSDKLNKLFGNDKSVTLFDLIIPSANAQMLATIGLTITLTALTLHLLGSVFSDRADRKYTLWAKKAKEECEKFLKSGKILTNDVNSDEYKNYWDMYTLIDGLQTLYKEDFNKFEDFPKVKKCSDTILANQRASNFPKQKEVDNSGRSKVKTVNDNPSKNVETSHPVSTK